MIRRTASHAIVFFSLVLYCSAANILILGMPFYSHLFGPANVGNSLRSQGHNLMIAAAAESVNTLEAGQPNYAQIYLYISSLLKGETPPSLPPLESSVVLSLIQDIVNKIRTSDVSGQMHYLSNWYKQFQSEKEAVQKNDSKQETPPQTKVPPTASAVKRTSSGRIVRPRVDLSLRIKEEDKATDTEGSGEDGQNDSKEHGNEVKNEPKPKPRSTSLNPFRIPVNLLNFKQTRSSLVAKQSPK
ncbi:uncharacterized protein LOC114524773 [Dendronephthya gigantea]|uniref:uncharacterized protein LOC114524773 n=1 Tax=Dendronephthya gigantea TaxID=151771 RepID=UPI00106A0B86|nr:uncharacterized protein LOC114524773 [Dendronephthya gigantea]